MPVFGGNTENTNESKGGDDSKVDLSKTDITTEKAVAVNPEKATGFCQSKAMLLNLVLMTVFWSTSSLNYFIITFYLKYIPGNIYTNTSLACIAEIIAYVVIGFIMDKFGVKLSFIISYILAATGGIFLVIFYNADGYLIGVFVLFAKFGISVAYQCCYLATPQMFPTVLTSTAFGIANLFSQAITMSAPLIAELDAPIPMSIFSITCIASAFFPICLRKVKKEI